MNSTPAARTKKTENPTAPYPAGIVTHTTVVVAGEQQTDIAVHAVKTPQARMTVAIGFLMMEFASAETARRILEAFSAVRAAMMGLDNLAPLPAPKGAEFAHNTLAVMWRYPPDYAVVRGKRYSAAERRTICWVDLHMGPVTWRIADHTGYAALLEVLRTAHKTAVVTFLDGPKFRADPTKVDAFGE